MEVHDHLKCTPYDFRPTVIKSVALCRLLNHFIYTTNDQILIFMVSLRRRYLMNEFLRHCYFLNADFPPFKCFFQTQMPDPKTFKQHFESKHPKSPMPPELVNVEA
ncbi:hypothetical protein fugu_010388 [Takifugu bimaculatus]|uniref:Uncharacterized protein n=1 Tax=Takifugu bimaculatus TaxID=433685 RepID=A0A4Z2CFF6_9TELE|nr:hypothetical protein fugu_010388 [Takifugu bimaculatus]